MRKISILLFLALFSQGVYAQGFFKKLGKALKESAQTIVTGGASTQETQWGTITVKHLIPNMTVSVQNVERNGENLQVTLLFTNTSSKKMQLWDLRSRKIFDNNGTQYNSNCMVGNELLTIGDAYNYFESQVPTKVVCSFGEVPKNSFVVSMIKFETSYVSDDKRYETPIEIRNITVPEYKPVATTAASATTSTNMGVFKGVWSKTSGSSGRDIELYGMGKKSEAYDGLTIYGTLSACINDGMLLNDGEITNIKVSGNTAEIEFICDRADEGEKGKAKLVYNPSNKSLAFTIIQAPGMCFWQDLKNYVMAKTK